uniref:Uncharacterized protein n=1 Tax=Chenopodium quinoa TaxID=63459 RepID=A0A803N7J0_CHEQI
MIKSLSLESIKIDACPNNCMLFWKDHANADECVKCHASKWKIDEHNSESSTSQCKPRRTPRKTMRYCPLIPRLQTMYMSSKTAASMIWHSDERVDDPDGTMRHLADSKHHKWRYDGRTFDGKQELRPAPTPLSAEEVLQQIDAEQAECTIRGWPKSLSAPLIQLSTFFKELCSMALKIDE